MNNEFDKIEGLLARSSSIRFRASEVIAKAQTDKHPYCARDDSVRILAAILACQARDVADRAVKQVGLTHDKVDHADRVNIVYDFFADSAQHVGTRPNQMQAARTRALQVLVDMSEDLISRAERLLESDETIDGDRVLVVEELAQK